MSRTEYSPWQWFWSGARNGYRLPVSDVPSDRHIERPIPRQLRPGPWNDHPSVDDVVTLPKAFRPPAHSANGRPVQAGHPTRRISWEVNAPYGRSTASVPAPAVGDYWVEGAPRPLWTMAGSNHYDKHVIVTDPNGGWWEMIGATNWGRWRCSGLAQFDRHGELVRGRPVVASKRSLLPVLWDRFDLPHLCTITVRGSDLGPEARHLGEWLVLDANKVSRPASDDGGRLWDALTTFGAVYGDHGGRANLSGVSGGQWAGVDWGGLEFRLSDFLVAE